MQNDRLSLVKNLFDEYDENEDDQGIVTIKLGMNTIQVNYWQLVRYSQLIRDEYIISDARQHLSERLLQFQQQNRIDIKNLKYFFQLFQEEEITISNDKYRDFIKLSCFLKVKKLTHQLKNYYESHIRDADFIIRLFVDEIDLQNNTDNVDYFFTDQIKNSLSDKINECLQNKLFQNIPIAIIYQIIENSDEEKISNDLLFDFINNSLDERFVLLKFIKLGKLSDEKFNEIEDNLFNLNENRKYYQYLSCNFDYIKELKTSNKKFVK